MNFERIENSFKTTKDGKQAVASQGMVATAFPEATRAGIEMLKKGGNAVDAACASAFALSVVEPQASGLGGQSMVIMHLDGKQIALDGISRAPARALAEEFGKGQRFHGYRATTIPTTVAVLAHMNFRYGKLDWKTVLQPAARLASKGYKITPMQSFLQEREIDKFKKSGSSSGADIFLDDGKAYKAGQLFRQPALAETFRRLARFGPRDFYQGEIAAQIDKDMKDHDGLLRGEDLAQIPWPVEKKVLSRNYRGLSVATMPPPSAGRTLQMVLMMLASMKSSVFKKRTPESFHYMSEVYQNPTDKQLLSRAYARTLAYSIRENIDPELPMVDPNTPDQDTTHLSVMDAQGNGVGITQSIERVYGSKVASPELGFLYNNYMCTFVTDDATHPHYLRPNAPAWSTVAPCLVSYKKRLWMVMGSPGSERIFSALSQFLSHMVDRGKNMGEAMLEPRFHCTVGGNFIYEEARFNKEAIRYLKDIGYKLEARDDWSFYHGAVHAVLRRMDGKGFQGVAEIRRDGTAGGPS